MQFIDNMIDIYKGSTSRPIVYNRLLKIKWGAKSWSKFLSFKGSTILDRT